MSINHSLNHLDVAQIERQELVKQMDARRLARANDTGPTRSSRVPSRLLARLTSFCEAQSSATERTKAGADAFLPFSR